MSTHHDPLIELEALRQQALAHLTPLVADARTRLQTVVSQLAALGDGFNPEPHRALLPTLRQYLADELEIAGV